MVGGSSNIGGCSSNSGSSGCGSSSSIVVVSDSRRCGDRT